MRSFFSVLFDADMGIIIITEAVIVTDAEHESFALKSETAVSFAESMWYDKFIGRWKDGADHVRRHPGERKKHSERLL